MADIDTLRRMSRLELLEQLAEKSRECDQLASALQQVQDRRRARRKIVGESEDLASAVMKLAGVEEAVNKAAYLYLAGLDLLEENEDEDEVIRKLIQSQNPEPSASSDKLPLD